MKNFWIILASIALAGLVFVGIGVACGARGGYVIDSTGIYVEGEGIVDMVNVSLNKFENIDAHISSGSLKFVQSNETKVVVENARENEFQVSSDNNVLSIKQNVIFTFFNFSTRRPTITVYLSPDITLDDVKIQVSSGTLDIDKMNCKTYYSKISSGKININNITATTVEYIATSGTMNSKNITADNFKARTSSGRQYFENVKAKTGYTRVTSGYVEINGCYMDQLKTDISSGKIVITNAKLKGYDGKATSGDIQIDGELKGIIKAYISSGTMKFNIQGNEKDYNRKFEKSSGSITVNGNKASEGELNLDAANSLDFKVTSGRIVVDFNK